MHREDRGSKKGSKKGSKVMEHNGTSWDFTGCYGTERRDLQNPKVPVRFLSHLPQQVLKLSRLLPHGV